MTQTDKEKLEEIDKLMSTDPDVTGYTEEERVEEIYRILQKKKKKRVKTKTDKERLEEIEKIISIDMTEKERVGQISRILSTVSFPDEDWEQKQALMKQQIRDESAEKIKQMVEKETIRKRNSLLLEKSEFGWSADTFAKERGLDPEKLSKCFYCADYFEKLFECDYCKDSYCEEHRLTEVHLCAKSYQRTDGIEPSQYHKKLLKRHRGKKGWFLK